MEINKYMFREYDIRGVYGKDINEEISYLIGKAFGTKLNRLGHTKTLVGYDNRYSSYISALLDGFIHIAKFSPSTFAFAGEIGLSEIRLT